MATAYLHSGTQLTLSVENIDGSQAVVANYVTAADDAQALAVAAEAFGSPKHYPYGSGPLTAMTLKAVQVSNFGSDKAFVTEIYGRDQSDPPVGDAFAYARETVVGEEYGVKYVTANYDNGGISTDYLSKIEDDYSAFSEIRVPVVVTANPLSSVTSLIGKINGDAITINGVSRDAQTVKFLGFDTDVTLRADEQEEYVGSYVLHWKEAGWNYDLFTLEYGNDFSRTATVVTATTYQTAVFSNAFPTHTGNEP